MTSLSNKMIKIVNTGYKLSSGENYLPVDATFQKSLMEHHGAQARYHSNKAGSTNNEEEKNII